MRALFFLNIERTNAQNQHIEWFQLSDVEISNSPFRAVMYTDLEYIMELDLDRLLPPFLREAGFDSKVET